MAPMVPGGDVIYNPATEALEAVVNGNVVARIDANGVVSSPMVELAKLSRAAITNNPRTNAVMSSPPTIVVAASWAVNRVYAAQEYAVTFQGSGTSIRAYLYQTSAGGTSAGTGPGPQTTTPSTDGTVTWTHITNLPCREFGQNLAENSYLWNDNTGLAKTGGAVQFLDSVPTVDASTHAAKLFKNTTAGVAAYSGGRFRTVIDSTAYVVRLFAISANSGYRIIDGGQYASLTRSSSPRSGWLYMFVTYGSRARRDTIIEADKGTYFVGVDVGLKEGIYPPPDSLPLTFIGTGDSHFTAAGLTYEYDSAFMQLCDLLGVRSAASTAIGGTGLIVTSSSGTAMSRLPDLLAQATYYPNHIIIEANGHNDAENPPGSTRTAGEIYAAERAYLQAIRAALPTSPIIVIGIIPVNHGGTPSGSTWAAGLAAEDEKAAAVVAMNDPLIFFIPLLRATGGPVFTGSGNDGAAANNGNADIYVNGSSLPHVNLLGANFYAQYLAIQIRRLLSTNGFD
jgi:hypothetical protein